MSWHAVRAIREAGVTTRGFLLPPDRGRWLRLAVLALVVGVGWLAPAIARLAVPGIVTPDDTVVAVAVGAVALAGVLADAYGRFALLSALRSRRLQLTEDLRWRLGRAIRWIVFGFGAGVLVTAAAGVAFRALRAGWLAATGGDPSGFVGVTVTATVGALALLAAVAVVGFAHATLSLLPAAMLATGAGALGSWRRLWGAFAGHRGGFFGYLVVRGLVAIGASAVALFGVGSIVAALAVVAFVGLVAAFGTVSAGVAALGGPLVVAAGGAVTLTLAVLPVLAVTTTYLTSYDLAVLGALDADLALLDGGDAEMSTPDDDLSVSLPDDGPVVPDATDGGFDPAGSADADENLGDFQFGTVEADEE